MDTTVLDNPAWHALKGRQAHFAIGDRPVLRYPAEVSPFAALETPAAMTELGRRMAEGEVAVLWSPENLEAPTAVDLLIRFPCLQMAGFDFRPADAEDAPALGRGDVPEMIDLAVLTKPGPFYSRTIEMGDFVGIRQHGRLAAMAGERMKPPGFTEISAICVHPDFQGRGHARRLTSIVGRRALAIGTTPFLNVLPDNAAAISLYESLGFRPRRLMQVHVLRKPGGVPVNDPFFSSL